MRFARSRWYNDSFSAGLALAYRPPNGSIERALLRYTKKEASSPDLEECEDFSNDWQTLIAACGVFRYGSYRGVTYIVYCYRTNIPGIGEKIGNCVPIARLQRGRWELAVVVAEPYNFSGGSSALVCTIRNLNNQTVQPDKVATMIGKMLIGSPLNWKSLSQTHFVMGGKMLNIDLYKWNPKLSGWGYIKLSGSLYTYKNRASLNVAMEILYSPRRMSTNAESKELQPDKEGIIFSEAMDRIELGLESFGDRTHTGECHYEI